MKYWEEIATTEIRTLFRSGHATIDGDILTAHEAGVDEVLRSLQDIVRPASTVTEMMRRVIVRQLLLESPAPVITSLTLMVDLDSAWSDQVDSDTPLRARHRH